MGAAGACPAVAPGAWAWASATSTAVKNDRIKSPPLDKLRAIAAVCRVPLRYLTTPLGWVPVEEPTDDALASIEATILSEPTLTEERKQAGLVVMRDLFAQSKEQAS